MDTRERGGPATPQSINGSATLSKLHGGSETNGILRAALTKEELQNLLFEHMGLSKRECRDLVNTIFEEMRAALAAGEPVKLEGFGRFQPKDRPRRWARNLKSGEKIEVAERRVVTFHPSRKLTENIGRRQPAAAERTEHSIDS